MGSKTFDGVWFSAFSHDHSPPHVHGQYGGVVVLVDLLGDGKVDRAKRPGAVKPPNGKRSHIRHILNTAARNYDALWLLWETTRGKAS